MIWMLEKVYAIVFVALTSKYFFRNNCVIPHTFLFVKIIELSLKEVFLNSNFNT